jgi:hypothetical protein
VEIADRIGFELLFVWAVLYIQQAADAMALIAPMQGRSGQMRQAGLQTVETVIQREQRLSAECHAHSFFGSGQDRGPLLLWSHRGISEMRLLAPLGHCLGVNPIARCQQAHALLTLLYRMTYRRGRTAQLCSICPINPAVVSGDTVLHYTVGLNN